MKLRVVDVYRAGLQWEFVSAGTENIPSESGQQLRFPPASELFSTSMKRDSISKEAGLPGNVLLILERNYTCKSLHETLMFV